MPKHIIDLDWVSWEAIKEGKQKFIVIKNNKFYQSGDLIALRRMNKEGTGYELDLTSTYFDLKFKLGWMIQGGQYGIDARHCIFQLEESLPLSPLFPEWINNKAMEFTTTLADDLGYNNLTWFVKLQLKISESIQEFSLSKKT